MQGPQRKLAALLRMFTLAFPRTTSAGLHAANDVVNMEPYCFRAHDAMSEFFGVSTQHVTTMIGPQAPRALHLQENSPRLKSFPRV